MVALIMSLGGIIGVMLVMFAAISQRIKDIGVMRVVGYKRWQILVSFMLESLAIALIGGLLGVVLILLINGIATACRGRLDRDEQRQRGAGERQDGGNKTRLRLRRARRRHSVHDRHGPPGRAVAKRRRDAAGDSRVTSLSRPPLRRIPVDGR